MNLASSSRVAGSTISPLASTTLATRDTSRRPPDQRSAPRVRKTGSQAFCASTVPKLPGDAPASATGLPPKTRAESAGGRDSQSIAFFATPGRLLLYSGETSSKPSAAAIASFSCATAPGIPEASSRSPSYSGMPAMVMMRSSLSSGMSDAAARRTAELYELRRKLPERPIRVSMELMSSRAMDCGQQKAVRTAPY